MACAAEAAGPGPAHSQASPPKCGLTLFQANVLVATLGGFWARQADGHPGPDLMGRGMLMLHALVEWERLNRRLGRASAPSKQPNRKPG